MTLPTFNQRAVTNSETLGQKLRRVREQSRFTIADISQRLQIKAEYLTAIEESRYTDLPSAVFVKNYVQRYVKILGVSFTTVEPLLLSELKVYERQPTIPTLKRYLTQRPLRIWTVVFGLLMLFVVLAIGTYFALEISHSIEPPVVTLETMPPKVAYVDRVITVAGQTVPEAVVSINEQVIPVLPDGRFSQLMSLQEGNNILKIEVKTKRSQSNIQYVQVYVDKK
ncbi:MAG: helix-turn-helix domain-containing protein [Patescibacteria group bacterium]|jgi:cytoskeletal protein RodZ